MPGKKSDDKSSKKVEKSSRQNNSQKGTAPSTPSPSSSSQSSTITPTTTPVFTRVPDAPIHRYSPIGRRPPPPRPTEPPQPNAIDELSSTSARSSGATISAAIKTPIYVAHSIETIADPSSDTKDYKYNIIFRVNPTQRPDTLIKGQGDHTTSYTAIIQAILSCVKGETLPKATELTRAFGLRVLDGSPMANDIREFEAPIVHKRGLRPHVVFAMENYHKQDGTNFDQEEIMLTNQELAYAKIALRTQHLSVLASAIINSAQKLDHTTYYHIGRINKKSNEGILAKNAARALLSLDRLCNIKKNGAEEDITELKRSISARKAGNSEDDHIIRYGISAWHGQKAEGIQAADQFEQAISSGDAKTVISTKADELSQNVTALSGYLGDLFDYQQNLDFIVTKENKAFNIDPTSNLSDGAIEQKVREYFNDDDYSVNVNKSKLNSGSSIVEITISRESISNLATIIANHINVINAAYPALMRQLKEQGTYELMVRSFIQHVVLEDQGWKHAPFLDKPSNLTIVDYVMSQKKVHDLINPQSASSSATAPTTSTTSTIKPSH